MNNEMDTTTNNRVLSEQQIKSLYAYFARRLRLERYSKDQETILPCEIFEEVENNYKNLAYNLKRVEKDVRRPQANMARIWLESALISGRF